MDTRHGNVFVRIATDNILEMLKDSGTMTFTHTQLANILECEYRSNSYKSRIYQLKKTLKVNGIFLVSWNRLGYLVADKGKEIDLLESNYRSGFKKMTNAVKDTNYINYNALSDADRENTLSRAQRMANLIALDKHSGLVD